MSLNWPKREDFDVAAVRGLRLYWQRQHYRSATEHGYNCVAHDLCPAAEYALYHIRFVITSVSYRIVSIINRSRSNGIPFQSCVMLENAQLRDLLLFSLLVSLAGAGFAATCSDDRTGRMAHMHEGEKGGERRQEEGDVPCPSPLHANSKPTNLHAQARTHGVQACGT